MSESAVEDQHEAEKSALIKHYEGLIATKDFIIAAQGALISEQSTTLLKEATYYRINAADTAELEDRLQEAEATISRVKRTNEAQLLNMRQMANQHVTQTRRARVAKRKSEWQGALIRDLELAIEANLRDFGALEKRMSILQYQVHIGGLRGRVSNLQQAKDGLTRQITAAQEKIDETKRKLDVRRRSEGVDDGEQSYRRLSVVLEEEEEEEEKGGGREEGETEDNVHPSTRGFSETVRRFVRGI